MALVTKSTQLGTAQLGLAQLGQKVTTGGGGGGGGSQVKLPDNSGGFELKGNAMNGGFNS